MTDVVDGHEQGGDIVSPSSAVTGAGVQSVDRALAIMSSFGAERPAVRVSELADEIGVHKSTASRMLATLERRQIGRAHV